MQIEIPTMAIRYSCKRLLKVCCRKEYAKQRAALINSKRASRSFIAGNPLPFDSKVKEWKYWVANITDAAKPGQPAPNAEPIRGTIKDTTHISVIDKNGNMFDSTP